LRPLPNNVNKNDISNVSMLGDSRIDEITLPRNITLRAQWDSPSRAQIVIRQLQCSQRPHQHTDSAEK
jgi:hypothetical protein